MVQPSPWIAIVDDDPAVLKALARPLKVRAMQVLQHHLNRAGIRIPTIVITANREAEMREQCEAAGAETYLLKPLDDTSLLEAIEDARAKSDRRRWPR